jgi:hypothetical protein
MQNLIKYEVCSQQQSIFLITLVGIIKKFLDFFLHPIRATHTHTTHFPPNIYKKHVQHIHTTLHIFH